MDAWKQFEENSTKYLNNNFSNNKNISFTWAGESDSNKPDIQVFKNKENIFNIEAKLSPSQSGQFVVKLKKDKFTFSKKNIYSKNKYSEKIIDFLNQNKENIDIDELNYQIECPENLLSSWIINHYNKKNSKFIITSNELDSFYSLVPINNLPQYFKTTAILRRKRSGTRHLPKRERKHIKKILRSHLTEIKAELINYEHINKRSIVEINRKLSQNECYFGDERYYLSYINDKQGHKYYIKKRSLTNNINVIFSLEYIGPQNNFGLSKLKSTINSF